MGVGVLLSFCVAVSVVFCDADPRPEIEAPPVNTTVNVGDTATFRCKGKGSPTPKMMIVREDSSSNHIKQMNVASKTDESTITIYKTIKDVSYNDAGWYVCIVANEHGVAVSKAYLEVRDLCKDVKCPRRKYCFANSTLGEGECKCKEYKDTTYNPVCGSDCKNYFNAADLKTQSCTENKLVRIEHKGTCDLKKVRVQVKKTKHQLFEGESLTLTCKVAGSPKPYLVKWVKKLANGKLQTVAFDKEYVVQSVTVDNSGTYRCIARQCDNKAKSADVEVLVESNASLDPVNTKTCRVFGDPHVMSFDGFKYNYQGSCNYVLAGDCQKMSWMLIGRFMPCGRGVTCLEDVTLYNGAKTPLMLTRGWIVGQNGEKRRLRKNVLTRIEDIEVKYTGLSVEMALPNGIRMVYDGFWGMQIISPPDVAMCGLCGDNDGDAQNDILGSRPGKKSSTDINSFAYSWQLQSGNWCKAPELVPTDELNTLCEGQDLEGQCRDIVDAPGIQNCMTALGHDFYKAACKQDVCVTQVPRFVGETRCAFASSLVQHCEVAGYGVAKDYLNQIGCNKKQLQKDIYNAGCPLQGNPPFIDV